ncbi:three-prime repair exonuclease 1 [Ochlerotatus camptorhynchus]|uniref:three-prime repair exonuclease 1 n=1 Tax=Ochlerotatus camptorhynchus TaxID=644619 RepID=UPI0031CFE505
MAQLESFVFFDLETTGLPGLQMPKITEISLIACSKKHLLNTKRGELPRILNKQTFCLNPQRVIHPKASETTGLYNDMLENESRFDENTAKLIALFLQRLQSPTCLVAHNGNRFDFVILKKELEALKAQLPDNTYCIDSLPLFQALEQERERKAKAVQENADNELADLELTAITAMEELEGSSSTLSQMQKLNETTPQRSKITENYKKVLRSYLDVTPSTQSQSSETTRQRKSPSRSKRQLFTTEGESSNSASPPSTPVPTTQLSPGLSVKKRFRLCDVHERLLGVPPKISHYAECDVEALLKCAIAEGSAFVAYAEEHGAKFQDFSGKF